MGYRRSVCRNTHRVTLVQTLHARTAQGVIIMGVRRSISSVLIAQWTHRTHTCPDIHKGAAYTIHIYKTKVCKMSGRWKAGKLAFCYRSLTNDIFHNSNTAASLLNWGLLQIYMCRSEHWKHHFLVWCLYRNRYLYLPCMKACRRFRTSDKNSDD